MSKFVFLLATLFLSPSIHAQTTGSTTDADTLAPYLKSPSIPSFSIQTPDSSWFSKVNLKANKPTLVLYFSPDCGHCQIETEEVLSRMKELGNLQIVMITSRSFEDMAKFAEHYKINRFPSVKIGTDPARMVTRFYNVKFTPFSALYDKKGKLVKAYQSGIDLPELVSLIK